MDASISYCTVVNCSRLTAPLRPYCWCEMPCPRSNKRPASSSIPPHPPPSTPPPCVVAAPSPPLAPVCPSPRCIARGVGYHHRDDTDRGLLLLLRVLVVSLLPHTLIACLEGREKHPSSGFPGGYATRYARDRYRWPALIFFYIPLQLFLLFYFFTCGCDAACSTRAG